MRVVTVGLVGPPGAPGAGFGALVWQQAAVSDAWAVNHNLGYYPNVTVFDSADSQIEGEVLHISENQLTVSFSSAFSGYAVLS